MSLNIRDLMRREKASRQRPKDDDERPPKKVHISASYTDSSTNPDVPSAEKNLCDANMVAKLPRIVEEIYELISDTEENYSVDSSSNIGLDACKDSSGKLLDASVSDVSTSTQLQIAGDNNPVNPYMYMTGESGGGNNSVGYSVADSILIDGSSSRILKDYADPASSLDEFSNIVNPSYNDRARSPNSDAVRADNCEIPYDISYIGDDDVRIYDQLNTAFCSRVDFECEQILSNVDGSDILPETDMQHSSKGTITSDNFGKSHMHVSKEENLPEGFFDHKKTDAQARGKLASKDASEKIKALTKDKAEVLNEAKYLQEKHLESFRERIRLEMDAQEHEETVSELLKKVECIKKELVLDEAAIDVEVEKGLEITSKHDLKLDENYDHQDDEIISWRMKSLI
ncbi:hypothetical protein X943_002652 [Babesia divergens]|uniref:Uncharacterized protein n=1 Tax=Babesia divergens TaxID=32595 RepID=A0AAD9GAI6_BABDI|nr:hypothetical protein X943_002652 [Babesia divergens]